MFRKFLNIALNPFFQAFVVVGLIVLFIPFGLNKYTAKQVEMMTRFDKAQFIFTDLDHDGYSEKICTFSNTAGNAGIVLYSPKNITLGQWNFRGLYQPGCVRFMTGDYNRNGLDEIYIFTIVSDSVILQGLEYSASPSIFINDRFIAKIGKSLKDPDYLVLPGSITDMNHDNKGDLVFGITAGFSRQPRNIFIYDIFNDELKRSPESGAYINKFLLSDITDDGNPEILLYTYTTDNYNDDPIPYSDSSAWMMVLNSQLGFLFPPVEFPGTLGSIQLAGISSENAEHTIFGRYGHSSVAKKYELLFIADNSGNIKKKREFGSEDMFANINLLNGIDLPLGKCIIGSIENIGFCKIDNDLDIKLISNVPFSTNSPVAEDIDQDGDNEIIILKQDHQQHLILRNDFSCPVAIDFPIQSSIPVFSIKLNGDQPPQLSAQGDQTWKLFDYGINPVYRFRFLIWLGIYLLILGFILLIRKLYSFQLKKKYETEQKITRLQLSGIKAQMEPHFIMNTINNIGSSIYRQKPEDAYRLLLNFSGMVRSLLISSDKLTLTLEEEIDFVRNYLELERSRFPELFNFSISMAEEISPEIIVPKMIIQMHAENALKHGLLPKKSGGVIDISIIKEQDYLLIRINDNGIGRNAASKKINESTGKGMKIMAQLFETYNKHNSRPLRQEIIDLFDEEKKPAGTLVKIWVPFDLNAEIY